MAERTEAQDTLLIQAELDQLRTLWYDMLYAKSQENNHDLDESVDQLIEYYRSHEHIEKRMIGQLADMGWSALLLGLRDAMETRYSDMQADFASDDE